MWKIYQKNVQQKHPLIHNITNYVTVNDCANMLLACGASPIMADAKEEVEEITSICQGLNLNIGTLNATTISSMLLAGKKANALHHPIILDPVGVGASTFRTNTAQTLMEELQISVLRGNISEIKTLCLGTTTVQGVDAAISDTVTKENLSDIIPIIKDFSKSINAIITVSGAIDIVTDGDIAYAIYNGHSMMSEVTGTGCMLSALTTAYVSANPNSILEAAATAVIAMGICGEIAHEKLTINEGNASYRTYIIDAMHQLTDETLEMRAKYDIY